MIPALTLKTTTVAVVNEPLIHLIHGGTFYMFLLTLLT